jgi:uncharacterized protein (TIGR03790 family)
MKLVEIHCLFTSAKYSIVRVLRSFWTALAHGLLGWAGLAILLPVCQAQNAEARRVLLVVNEKSAISRRLGAFYQQWHWLAAGQVCRIATAEAEDATRAVYDKEIAGPVGRCLQRSGAVESTHYVVLTRGIPIRITAVPGVEQKRQTTDVASVDSELALLYQKLHGVNYPLPGPRDNPFFGRKEEDFSHPAFALYLVTRLAGYSFEDARRAVERCRGARNIGKVVLDLKNDDDEDGNRWLRNAGIILPANRVILEETQAVVNFAQNVIGYGSWGSNDRQRRSRKSGMQWLPGSIASEFVSSNLRTLANPPTTWTLGDWSKPLSYFAGSPQSLSLDYIWEGASGVSGHVDEPFLTMTPRPEILFPAYLGGRNLAESYYLSMPALSWMTIIVGDPLCRLEP